MVKIIIQIIFVVMAIAWLSEIKLTVKPFMISFPSWRASLGIIIICIGIGVYYNAAFRKGHSRAIDQVMEIMDKHTKDKQPK